MGYSHYHNLAKKPSKAKFEEFANVCKKMHKALPSTTDTAGGYHSSDPLSIKCGMGRGEPEFSANRIDFNGNEFLGLEHETFRIERRVENEFCKTNRKPYDLLAVACLIAASQMLPGFTFSSDGFTDNFVEMHSVHVHECDDLQQGLDLYNEVMEKELTQDDLWAIRAKHYK